MDILVNIRRNARKNYHQAIKYVCKNRSEIIKENVALALQSSNGNKFWEEINKIKIHNNSVTNVMDGKIGEKEIVKGIKRNMKLVIMNFVEIIKIT